MGGRHWVADLLPGGRVLRDGPAGRCVAVELRVLVRYRGRRNGVGIIRGSFAAAVAVGISDRNPKVLADVSLLRGEAAGIGTSDGGPTTLTVVRFLPRPSLPGYRGVIVVQGGSQLCASRGWIRRERDRPWIIRVGDGDSNRMGGIYHRRILSGAIGSLAVADLDGDAVAALALEVQGGLGLELAGGVDLERRGVGASQRVGQCIAGVIRVGGCVGAADARVSRGVLGYGLRAGSVIGELRRFVHVGDGDGHGDGVVNRRVRVSVVVHPVGDRDGDGVTGLGIGFVVEDRLGL